MTGVYGDVRGQITQVCRELLIVEAKPELVKHRKFTVLCRIWLDLVVARFNFLLKPS